MLHRISGTSFIDWEIAESHLCFLCRLLKVISFVFLTIREIDSHLFIYYYRIRYLFWYYYRLIWISFPAKRFIFNWIWWYSCSYLFIWSLRFVFFWILLNSIIEYVYDICDNQEVDWGTAVECTWFLLQLIERTTT